MKKLYDHPVISIFNGAFEKNFMVSKLNDATGNNPDPYELEDGDDISNWN